MPAPRAGDSTPGRCRALADEPETVVDGPPLLGRVQQHGLRAALAQPFDGLLGQGAAQATPAGRGLDAQCSDPARRAEARHRSGADQRARGPRRRTPSPPGLRTDSREAARRSSRSRQRRRRSATIGASARIAGRTVAACNPRRYVKARRLWLGERVALHVAVANDRSAVTVTPGGEHEQRDQQADDAHDHEDGADRGERNT